jgi:hypothetical protein
VLLLATLSELVLAAHEDACDEVVLVGVRAGAYLGDRQQLLGDVEAHLLEALSLVEVAGAEHAENAAHHFKGKGAIVTH